MRHMIRGLSLGYGASGLAGAALFATCACLLLAIGVFWLGGALGALALTVFLHERDAARAREEGYSLQ